MTYGKFLGWDKRLYSEFVLHFCVIKSGNPLLRQEIDDLKIGSPFSIFRLQIVTVDQTLTLSRSI